MIDAGVDVVELGVPYSDPVMDGPIIQRAVDAALAGGTRVRRHHPRGRAGGRPRCARAGHDVLEPRAALRRRRVRAGPRRGRRRRADHARPHPRRGGRLDRRLGRARPGPRVPRRAQLDARAPGLHGGRLARVRLRRLDHGRDGGARDASAPRPSSSSPTPARPAPSACASGSASPVPSRPPRSPGTPTASSSARPSCATLLDASDDAAGRDALARLTADLAEGVRSATRDDR